MFLLCCAAKADRLKQAKQEAEKEIKAYKAQREEAFQKRMSDVSPPSIMLKLRGIFRATKPICVSKVCVISQYGTLRWLRHRCAPMLCRTPPHQALTSSAWSLSLLQL